LRWEAVGAGRVLEAAEKGGSIRAEELADLAEEALALGVDVLSRLLGKLLEQLALTGAQLGGGLDDPAHQLIPAAAAVEVGNALPPQGLHLPALGAGTDLELEPSIQRGDLHLRPEGGLGEGDGHLAHHVVVLTREDGVLLDVHGDVEVAGGAAALSGLTLSCEADARPGVDAAGDADLQGLLGRVAPGTAAPGAG